MSIAMRVKTKRQKSRQTLHSKSKLKSTAQPARSTCSLPQPHSSPWSRSTKICRKPSMTRPKPCIPDTTPRSSRSPRIARSRRGRRSCWEGRGRCLIWRVGRKRMGLRGTGAEAWRGRSVVDTGRWLRSAVKLRRRNLISMWSECAISKINDSFIKIKNNLFYIFEISQLTILYYR